MPMPVARPHIPAIGKGHRVVVIYAAADVSAGHEREKRGYAEYCHVGGYEEEADRNDTYDSDSTDNDLSQALVSEQFARC